jgi:hypothetical protein
METFCRADVLCTARMFSRGNIGDNFTRSDAIPNGRGGTRLTNQNPRLLSPLILSQNHLTWQFDTKVVASGYIGQPNNHVS